MLYGSKKKNALLGVGNNYAFAHMTFLLTGVVFSLRLVSLGTNRRSFYPVKHNFFCFWERGQELLRGADAAFWQYNFSSQRLFQKRKNIAYPYLCFCL